MSIRSSRATSLLINGSGGILILGDSSVGLSERQDRGWARVWRTVLLQLYILLLVKRCENRTIVVNILYLPLRCVSPVRYLEIGSLLESCG